MRFERITIIAAELEPGDRIVPAPERLSETPEHGTGLLIADVQHRLTKVTYQGENHRWYANYAADSVFTVDRPLKTVTVEVELTENEAADFLRGVSTPRIKAIAQIAAGLAQEFEQ